MAALTLVLIALTVVWTKPATALPGTTDVDQDTEPTTLDGILERLKVLEEKNAILEMTVLEQQHQLDQLSTAQKECALQASHKDERRKRFVVDNSLPIAFTARINSVVQDHVNPGDVITFGNILTNHGGGLNASTSVFTVPMAGIYIIACSLMDHTARQDGSGVMLHADIVKNGHVVLGRVFAHAEGITYRDQGAQTVIVELLKGDRVWVRNWDSKDLGVGGQLYSTFSGYLLWPLE